MSKLREHCGISFLAQKLQRPRPNAKKAEFEALMSKTVTLSSQKPSPQPIVIISLHVHTKSLITRL